MRQNGVIKKQNNGSLGIESSNMKLFSSRYEFYTEKKKKDYLSREEIRLQEREREKGG